ncbi:MAG: SLC13 family permease [Xanthomonadales bacterium]|nr:SLC13 family permease [Xanthomonadales bacterium]MDZ4117632.1 SLC13 family permease [Xanthomonadaceae bacterium]MDZ4377268.1 SLC13 family permease [Xanthomonadaceae bacterium]
MGIDAILTLAVIVIAVWLFVSEKLPSDVVALLILASLLVLQLVTPAEAVSGFSSPATITVAAMFVLSSGLSASGVVHAMGRLIARVRRPLPMTLLVMVLVGLLSAFINNTAAVAVFLPVVLATTAANRIPASQLLIPMSYAAQMAGVCTLVGTSTNLLVNSLARNLGHPGFGLFEFTKLGLIMLAAGFVYILLVQRWLLPHSHSSDPDDSDQLGKYITELRVPATSPLIGSSVADAKLGERYGVYVLELLRNDTAVAQPRAETIRSDDLLIVRGDWSRISELIDKNRLQAAPDFQPMEPDDGNARAVMAEVMIAPGSALVGHTLVSPECHWHYRSAILAIHRRGDVLRSKLRDVNLRVGDVLLLRAPGNELPSLRRNPALLVLSAREHRVFLPRQALLTIAIMATVMTVAALGWLPLVASAILGCIALVATRCIDNNAAYESIDWRVIMLLAGVIPLGIAMQKSGLAQFIAGHLLGFVGDFGPLAVLAAVYLLTAVLTELMSNNATAVLITPIAYSTALAMGLSPTPFLIAVLFAASTSFATPIGYQTNTMVYNAGNYRFTDFMKIGIPLNLLFWALAVFFIPRFFPF